MIKRIKLFSIIFILLSILLTGCAFEDYLDIYKSFDSEVKDDVLVDNKIYAALGTDYFKKDEDNGVLLLISKSDTRVRLEIGEGLEGCLNDSKCGRILDNYFVPYREKSEYSTGTYETIKAVVSVIAKDYDVTIGEVDSSIAEEIEKQDELTSGDIWFIIIIIILILFVGFIIGVPDSGSTYRGGGFSSGGGGFSGGSFGGGSFGGGGASR